MAERGGARPMAPQRGGAGPAVRGRAAALPPVQTRRARRDGPLSLLWRFFVYAVLIAGAATMLAPFLWMVTTSLKTYVETIQFPPKWLPIPAHWENYLIAWTSAPFGRYFYNSTVVAVVTTVAEVFTTALAAYAFARLDFWGKNTLFIILLGTIMIPGEVLLVPNFITLVKLGWINTYYALIVPWVVSVFGIFFLRQAFLQLPQEVFDSAKIDGAGHFRTLWQIAVPLVRPVITTVALFKFIGSWNAFLWVLIVTNRDSMRTLPVGLSYFQSEIGVDYHLLMAGATISVLPVLVLFFFAQKQFIQGIARTGLK